MGKKDEEQKRSSEGCASGSCQACPNPSCEKCQGTGIKKKEGGKEKKCKCVGKYLVQTTPTVTLSNGVELPLLAMGCSFRKKTTEVPGFEGYLPEEAWRAINLALQVGYRSFDGARNYGSERNVGSVLGWAFAEGWFKREDVFLGTKLAHPHHRYMNETRTVDFQESPEILAQKVNHDMAHSLNDMGVGYFDLAIMHWPGDPHAESQPSPKRARATRAAIWKVFEGFLQNKTARAIGVANFTEKHLEELFEDCTVKPMVNQIELHPYCQQQELEKFNTSKGLITLASSPLGGGALGLLKDKVISEIAARLQKEPAQVVLRWHFQNGRVSSPRSHSKDNLASNLDILQWELSPSDMKAIKSLQSTGATIRRVIPDPACVV